MTTYHHNLRLTEYERIVLQRTLLQALNDQKIKLDLMESLADETQNHNAVTNSGYSLIKKLHASLENIKTCYIHGELAVYTGDSASTKPFHSGQSTIPDIVLYEIVMAEGANIGRALYTSTKPE